MSHFFIRLRRHCAKNCRGIYPAWRQSLRHLRLLRQFVDGQQRDPQRIVAFLSLGESDEARRLAHDLKGAGATLGAGQLATLAAAVQQGLRPQASADEAAAVPAQAQALEVEMQRLVDGLAAWPAAVPQPA